MMWTGEYRDGAAATPFQLIAVDQPCYATPMKSIVPGLLMLSLTLGCGYRVREQAISAADLRYPERTEIVNYMSAPIRPGSPSETPDVEAVSRSALSDSARIQFIAPDQLCFPLVVRSAVNSDTPIKELRILANGRAARVQEGAVTIRDYPYSGERDVLVAEHVAPGAYSALRVTQPVERMFRVIERSGVACVTVASSPSAEVRLEVIRVEDDNRGNWGELFVWQIE
jgi:hypothetical protein